jgi:hypothetical protein
MKIIRFTAENVKKLTLVEITPDGNVVQITGPNAAGKSAVLDAIMYALEGTANVPSQPIRTGQKSARIKLDLGDLVVTRKFTPSGSTLTVESADGASYKSPQKMLDALLGSLSFDPLAFTRMDAKQQFDVLRKLIKLDVDIDALDATSKSDAEQRTELNRTVKALHAQIQAFEAFPENLPTEPLDTSALVDEIANVGKFNADIETRGRNRTTLAEKAIELRKQSTAKATRAEEYRKLAEAAETESTTLLAEADAITARLMGAPPLPEPKDAAAVRARLEAAQVVNKYIDRRKQCDALLNTANETQDKAEALTNAIAARYEQKRVAIQAANMPVPNLGLGDGVVLLNELPLDQASSAEQLRVSCAIAMASNSKLRVLRIKDGSLLDDNGLALLTQMAKDNDYQLWIESVDTSGKVGIVMEDGHVATVNAVD